MVSPNTVRVHRVERGWSQVKLARIAELPGPALSAIEREQLAPWPKARRSLAAALGVDEAVLFPAEGK
jgi:transcriptional regulator with XRE-family HTH domain